VQVQELSAEGYGCKLCEHGHILVDCPALSYAQMADQPNNLAEGHPM